METCCDTADEYVVNKNKNHEIIEEKTMELKKLWKILNTAMEKRGLLIEVRQKGDVCCMSPNRSV